MPEWIFLIQGQLLAIDNHRMPVIFPVMMHQVHPVRAFLAVPILQRIAGKRCPDLTPAANILHRGKGFPVHPPAGALAQLFNLGFGQIFAMTAITRILNRYRQRVNVKIKQIHPLADRIVIDQLPFLHHHKLWDHRRLSVRRQIIAAHPVCKRLQNTLFAPGQPFFFQPTGIYDHRSQDDRIDQDFIPEQRFNFHPFIHLPIQQAFRLFRVFLILIAARQQCDIRPCYEQALRYSCLNHLALHHRIGDKQVAPSSFLGRGLGAVLRKPGLPGVAKRPVPPLLGMLDPA